VNLTECEIRSVLFGPHGRVEEWNLTRDELERGIDMAKEEIKSVIGMKERAKNMFGAQ
jgi:hypothetical protein